MDLSVIPCCDKFCKKTVYHIKKSSNSRLSSDIENKPFTSALGADSGTINRSSHKRERGISISCNLADLKERDSSPAADKEKNSGNNCKTTYHTKEDMEF